MATARTIVGVFTNTTSAENALETLHNAGFSNDQLTYSGHGRMGGGFWENVKSMFAGTETTSDSVVNDLMNQGLTQDEATYYAREHEAGHPIVAVSSDDRAQEAAQILQSNSGYSYAAGTGASSAGAYDQSTTYNQTGYNQDANYAATEQYAQPGNNTSNEQYDRTAEYANNNDVNTDEERRLRLREERLQADKQTVQSGEVNLRKNVITEQQSIDVPVQHEEVYIERQDLGGRPTDASIGQDESIRVPVREEQVNVTKTAVETGEVKIGKRTVQGNQRVTDTVQREEAQIDRSGDMPLHDATTDDTIDNR